MHAGAIARVQLCGHTQPLDDGSVSAPLAPVAHGNSKTDNEKLTDDFTCLWNRAPLHLQLNV